MHVICEKSCHVHSPQKTLSHLCEAVIIIIIMRKNIIWCCSLLTRELTLWGRYWSMHDIISTSEKLAPDVSLHDAIFVNNRRHFAHRLSGAVSRSVSPLALNRSRSMSPVARSRRSSSPISRSRPGSSSVGRSKIVDERAPGRALNVV